MKDLKLKDSIVYKKLDEQIGLTDKIKELVTKGEIINEDNALLSFSELRQNSKFFKIKQVLKAFEDKKIVLYYSDEVTTGFAVPIIPGGKGDKVDRIIVNASAYCSVVESIMKGKEVKTYKFKSVHVLYNLLLAAYAAYQSSRDYTQLMVRDFDTRMNGMQFYIKLMMGMFARCSSIASNQRSSLGLQFLLGKFFHITLLGMKDNDELVGIIKNNLSVDDDIVIELQIKMKNEKKMYDDIEEFLKCLKGQYKQLEKLDVKNLIKSMTNTFSSTSVLCIDYLPYLVMLAMSHSSRYAMYQTSTIQKEIGMEAIKFNLSVSKKMD